mgnify:CR=1 FL=1
MFSFSKYYWIAIVARFCTGLFNGNIGTIKSYLGRVTDSTNQTMAMAYLSAAWGFGSIIAPAIGGLLASPAEQYPDTFTSQFWHDWPYTLPGLVGAFLMVFSFAFVYFFMVEPPVAPPSGSLYAMKRLSRSPSVSSSLGGSRPASRAASFDTSRPAPMLNSSAPAPTISRSSSVGVFDAVRSLFSSSQRQYAPMTRGGAGSSADLLGADVERGDGDDFDEDAGVDEAELERREEVSLKRQMLHSTGMYGLVCFIMIFFDETLPLFARASADQGGLGFLPTDIGIILSAMGCVILIYTVVAYRPLSARVGLMPLFRWCTLICVPCSLAWIGVQQAAGNVTDSGLWALVLSNLVLRGLCGVTIFTSVMTFVNNSVPRDRMGRANGLGQTWAALARAIGPTVAGAFWSFTENSTFPLHETLSFILMALMFVGLYAATFTYPEFITRPFAERYTAEGGEETEEDEAGEAQEEQEEQQGYDVDAWMAADQDDDDFDDVVPLQMAHTSKV